jgi:enoyl-CoA hydratase
MMPGPNQHISSKTNGGTRLGAERLMLQEWHYFYENTKRWRDLRKITIAQVHGTVYAAGLMLMWACDLIVSAESARFADVVGTRLGAERLMLQEWHYFYENTKRWRDLRKITIAQVHGTVYAAGLMLMWACDLICAAENARFADVVGTRLGMCGLEYFAHPWEFGPRKTKELMLTGDAIDAEEGQRLGMISKVFPDDELSDRTLEFARRIAALPTMTALLIKESVNQTVDNMGFSNALAACFTMHELNHAHWAWVHAGGMPAGQEEDGITPWKDAPPVVLAKKDEVRSSV